MSVEETRKVMEIYWSFLNPEIIAENAVYKVMPTGEETRGRDNILDLIRNFYSMVFEGDTEDERSFFADGHAVLEGTLVAKHVGTFAGIAPTGNEVRLPMAIIYDVGDGHVQGARIYLEATRLSG